jgi:hypothetical protein
LFAAWNIAGVFTIAQIHILGYGHEIGDGKKKGKIIITT